MRIPLELIRSGELLRDTQNRGAKKYTDPLEVAGYAVQSNLTLSDTDLASTTAGRVVPKHAYELIFRRRGSTPGAHLLINIGGQDFDLYPGDRIQGEFFAYSVRNASDGVALGTARLVHITHPAASWDQLPASPADGGITYKLVGPGGATTQTANSAAGNVPTTAGDGTQLIGCVGFRVLVSADSTRTLSGGGSIRLWGRSTTLARFAIKPIAYTDLSDATTKRDWQGPDEVVSVPEGELYAEAVSVTVSAGAVNVAIETWG